MFSRFYFESDTWMESKYSLIRLRPKVPVPQGVSKSKFTVKFIPLLFSSYRCTSNIFCYEIRIAKWFKMIPTYRNSRHSDSKIRSTKSIITKIKNRQTICRVKVCTVKSITFKSHGLNSHLSSYLSR